jgi:carboxypeptidase family protein
MAHPTVRTRVAALMFGCTLAAAATAGAQGVQGGEIRGLVTDSTGAVAVGATVTLGSPAMQGDRSVTTDRQGAYIVRALPPGRYTATFALPGFTTVQRTIELSLGAAIDVSVTLAAGAVTEEVTVVGLIENAVRSPQVSVSMTKEMVDPLPIGRSPFGIAAIMPGLTTATPNAGQLAIAGAFSYDNVFLVDGTDVNDNLFGTADALYIEDAIDETQALTGGISAEYGRFSDGVVNVVSRRGGDSSPAAFERHGPTRPGPGLLRSKKTMRLSARIN